MTKTLFLMMCLLFVIAGPVIIALNETQIASTGTAILCILYFVIGVYYQQIKGIIS
jgi:hypothetical protein